MFNKSLNIWHSCFCFIIAIPWKITRKNNAKYLYTLKPWFNEQVRHMYLVCSLYRIIYYIKCKMLSKSSKWEDDLFTILQNSLYRGSLYQGLSVLILFRVKTLTRGVFCLTSICVQKFSGVPKSFFYCYIAARKLLPKPNYRKISFS